ncbi:MAG: peptidase S8 and S53, subtilisin, kexin, sedolisin [Parcubacteria group bacterium GW2011_GWA2_53_21]|nr:MAG: peptidase S8 and S53, subtilisin, kexin, sedolisin [Parcubacteria group bacterium GW2011_GWA2_53_21]
MKHLSLVLFLALLFQAFPVFAQTPNDPLLDRLWYLDRIHASDAWETTTGHDGVVVAVLDSGVDLGHPDIEANVWLNEDEISGNGLDDDGNGRKDDVHGWDFVDGDADPNPEDAIPFDPSAVSHGTLVAGIIGAVGNNAEGIAGINWDVRIMPLRILNRQGVGGEQAAIDAINYALDNGADVINMSFTGRNISTPFSHAVKKAYDRGVVFVAAVGNDGENGQANLNRDPIYPACLKGALDDDWVIGVAATTSTDEKAGFSNYGRNCTDISAPGVDLFGTSFYDPDNASFDERYTGFWQGTSMAAPMVSGSAALLLSRFPTLTPAQMKIILQLSVDPVKTKGTAWFGQLGSGRVNVARALEFAAAYAPPIVRGVTKTPIAFAAGPGHLPEVNLFTSNGEHLASYLVYEDVVAGGISVLVDDFDQDGEAEFAVVPRSGGEARVKWFEMDGTLGAEFIAFPGVTGGFALASGDLDADGKIEFVVSSRDGEARLEVFTIKGEKKFDIALESNRGLTVDVGDVDGTLGDEIVLAPIHGAPVVRVLKGDGTPFNTMTVGNPAQTDGIYTALADLSNNGRKQIVVGARRGGDQWVRAFNFQGALTDAFLAGAEGLADGMQVVAGDVNADGRDDVIVMSDRNPTAIKAYQRGAEILSWGLGNDIVIGDTELGAWSF